MNKKEIEFLEKNGWEVVCEHPLEIEYVENREITATGIAARYVLEGLVRESLLERGNLMDIGPFSLDTKSEDPRLVSNFVFSEAILEIKGDFFDREEKLKYVKSIAAAINESIQKKCEI